MYNESLKQIIINHFDKKTNLTYDQCRRIEQATGNREIVENHFNTKNALSFSECNLLIDSL